MATLDLSPPGRLLRTCATPNCNEHCAHCRKNDRLAMKLEETGFWSQLAAGMYKPAAAGGAAAGAGGAAAVDADHERLSPPCYLHEVALAPTATVCVAIYNATHMDSCGQCKYNHIKVLNSPDVKYFSRGDEVFVLKWG